MLQNRNAWRHVGLITSFLLSVIFLCAPLLAKPRTLPDQIVATPVGSLRITNLKCSRALGFQFVDGNIVNETSKSWDILYLAINLHDKNGVVKPKEGPDPIIRAHDPSASAGIAVKDLGIGTTVKLRYQEEAKADNDTFSATFKFADGRYPVHYKTALTTPVADTTLKYHDDALAITFSL